VAPNPEFDLFALKDFHQQLRASAGALCETQIAPFAKDVDEKSRFPEEALAALNGAGYNAIHVPEAFGGQGADSVATCIDGPGVARRAIRMLGIILIGNEDGRYHLEGQPICRRRLGARHGEFAGR
jgi:hypothetical protein